jgi:AraC-like DNA-binding protein
MAGFHGRSADLVDFRLVPYPAVTVFIDFGDGLVVDEASGQELRGSVAAGLAPGAVLRGRSLNIECLQVRLSPTVAHAALGAFPELSGTLAAFDDLWGPDAARFQEQLRAASSWDERFALAEAALARRQEAGRAVDPEVAFAWEQMAASRGRVRVGRLAAEAGWGRKRLWSRFRSQIGVTPKRAAQLVRFDHAAHRLSCGHSPALVAAESGYADQSHLHHEVMAFAGMTPSAVAVAPWLSVDAVAWPSA